uniref:Uncharacterized protein n=1 Tax=Anguilla anguilla TaxID=7936 RepID=A0A0E9T285_ANGAN
MLLPFQWFPLCGTPALRSLPLSLSLSPLPSLTLRCLSQE